MENLPEPENVAEKMPPTVAVNLRERLATVSQKMKKDMRTAPDESDPGLAAQIVPLRDWLGMDLLNNKAISRNLDRVLEQLEQRATEAAKKNESNIPQEKLREYQTMLGLARQVWQESCAHLQDKLLKIEQLDQAMKMALQPNKPIISLDPHSVKDYWPTFREHWVKHPSPMLLLVHIGLLGCIYGNFPSGDRLLSYAAEHFVEPWRIHARLMLAVGFERDLSMAQVIYQKRIMKSAPPDYVRLTKCALENLEQRKQLRERMEKDVFGMDEKVI